MRTYDKEFKDEAVKLAKEIGTQKAAEQLGVPFSTLSSWRYKKDGPPNLFSDKIVPQTATEVRLMKENKELKRANEILKEALGFFAKSQKK